MFFILIQKKNSPFFFVKAKSKFDNPKIGRKTPQNIDRGSPLRARFKENLKPGRTYQVVVKTVSGSVASWPATGNVTTRPLPVQDTIQAIVDEETQETLVVWRPNPDSFQDGYKVRKENYLLMKEKLLICCPIYRKENIDRTDLEQ